MAEEKPLTNKKYLLEKYPGKGGWTYTVISEISKDKRSKFGWLKVKGTIDDYRIKNYNLMPMSDGRLFLPVRAEIRKKIKKEAGDWVNVTLHMDNDPTEIPEEFLLCLKEDPVAHKNFFNCTDGQRKEFINWIYSAKRVETRVERISATLNKLAKGEKHRTNFGK